MWLLRRKLWDDGNLHGKHKADLLHLMHLSIGTSNRHDAKSTTLHLLKRFSKYVSPPQHCHCHTYRVKNVPNGNSIFFKNVKEKVRLCR